jgi:hypothetical protein
MARPRKLQLPDEVRAYFASASARRIRYPHQCAQCDEAFLGIAQARYCSRRCRVRAYRQRRAERPEATGDG